MTTMSMKRSRENGEVEALAMANCLMLLSRVGETASSRVFECKTCNRQFTSFQALGGHRASHKRPKLMAPDFDLHFPSSPVKPKTHDCSICGQEFAIGQALGGHMRRHRAAMSKASSMKNHYSAEAVPVIKKSNSKRVLSLDLDLNLTPFENHLKFTIGKMVPVDSSELGMKPSSLRSVKKRKEEYDRARARIFRSPSSPESEDTEVSGSSRW
ncbi:hypothetical protein F0562_000913 [Nyssa sinensis]|uniref:C2H2-type domain-containing protein n=1 Tax=Nyssa sinensis TaxID=561372 RepID=A0A5J5C1Y2_9ASTE|nr:hypothetical protein F0562_000913 [Nyssa sinensis]